MSSSFRTVFLVSALCALCFWAGAAWRAATPGTSAKYTLKMPVEIQISPDQRGTLPRGVVLYQYRVLPEVTTYYTFINLKESNVLSPYDEQGKFNLIVPASAFPRE